MQGTFETIDGRPALRFERDLAHPVDAVWRAVTDPVELAHWFPTHVTVDLRIGGAMSFVFPDQDYPDTEGEVIELDPPHRFAFTWGGELMRFELEARGEGCRLRLTNFLEDREVAARDAAGWHVCLDNLVRQLASGTGRAPSTRPTEEWRGLYAQYTRQGFPAGAPVPDDH